MPLITQSIVDGILTASSPSDVASVVNQMVDVINGRMSTTVINSATRIDANRLARPLASLTWGPVQRNITANRDFTTSERIGFKVPDGMPPLVVIGGTALFVNGAANAQGSVAVFVNDNQLTEATALAATQTTYELGALGVVLYEGDMLEVRSDTNAGFAFSPLTVVFNLRARLVYGPNL